MSILDASLSGGIQFDVEMTRVTGTGGDKFFVHKQVTPSDTWIVHHNLSKKPSVTVVDSADTVVIGEVEYIDTNTVQLKFIGAFAGRAYCN